MSTILIIEDNPASLQLMICMVQALGHAAISARTGALGLELARTNKPDLILSDIQLPGLSGIDVCREIKRDEQLRSIPVIAVTAYAMIGDEERFVAHGFNDYISKPVEIVAFLELLRKHLPVFQVSMPIFSRGGIAEA